MWRFKALSSSKVIALLIPAQNPAVKSGDPSPKLPLTEQLSLWMRF